MLPRLNTKRGSKTALDCPTALEHSNAMPPFHCVNASSFLRYRIPRPDVKISARKFVGKMFERFKIIVS
jgi:hypothetical protein